MNQAEINAIELLELGAYPGELSEVECAVLSQAISLKRIADALERLDLTALPARALSPAAAPPPAKRIIGKVEIQSRNEGKPADMAAGVPIPDKPVKIPRGFRTDWEKGTMPVDPMTEITVLWRNGTKHTNAAQTFHWKGAEGKAWEVIAIKDVPLDPAYTAKETT